MSIPGCIRYVLDPSQGDVFEACARRWAAILPRCGGDLLGCFLPHEGTSHLALALIGFASLADGEAYRARIAADPEGGEVPVRARPAVPPVRGADIPAAGPAMTDRCGRREHSATDRGRR